MDDVVLLQTLMDDMYKALHVNIITGEFQPIKVLTVERRSGFLKAKHIDDYLKTEADTGFVHALDKKRYLEMTSLANIRRRVNENHRKLMYSFRRKIDSTYQWITFEVMIPKGYNSNNPWVLYLWKKSDSDACEVEDALRMQSGSYYEILKVNLTEDSVDFLKLDLDSWDKEKDGTRQFSAWVTDFVTTGNLYEADVPVLLDFLQLSRLRDIFSENRNPIRTIYRRKVGEVFRWVMLEMLPGMEYRMNNQIVMLYVRDVHDVFMEEMAYHKHLEYHAKFDSLTGLHNLQAYQRYCQQFQSQGNLSSVMAVYANLNCVEQLNEMGGHEQGNAYIKWFSRMLMEFFGSLSAFCLGGDSFVVIIADIEEERGKKMFADFYHLISKQAYPMASLGYAWMEQAYAIEDVVRMAEKNMYEDKKNHYEKYSQR